MSVKPNTIARENIAHTVTSFSCWSAASTDLSPLSVSPGAPEWSVPKGRRMSHSRKRIGLHAHCTNGVAHRPNAGMLPRGHTRVAWVGV